MATVVVALTAALTAALEPAGMEPGAARTELLREYCGLLRGCGLPEPAGVCTAAAASGVAGVAYDSRRCEEPRLLHARGVFPGGVTGFRVYRFLGRRYQVEYRLDGELDISVPRLNALLGDLPLAARLLSHFQ